MVGVFGSWCYHFMVSAFGTNTTHSRIEATTGLGRKEKYKVLWVSEAPIKAYLLRQSSKIKFVAVVFALGWLLFPAQAVASVPSLLLGWFFVNCYICVFNIIYVNLIKGHAYGHVHYSGVLIILCPSSSPTYYADFTKGKNTMKKKMTRKKKKTKKITGAIISLLTI